MFILTWQNNSPFEDICLYMCHCFQHYLVINFEVIDPYIFWLYNNFLNKILNTQHVYDTTLPDA